MSNAAEFDEKIKELTEKIKLEPENAELYENRAYIYREQDKYNKAIEDSRLILSARLIFFSGFSPDDMVPVSKLFLYIFIYSYIFWVTIDSNQFIFGISGTDPASEKLMLLLPSLDVVIPRLVIKEVTRNLNDDNTKLFYTFLNKSPNVKIIDEPAPISLVNKYVRLGLPDKADAWIGAFAEWQGVKYLISDNRHFLSELTGASFEVLRPGAFFYRYYPPCTTFNHKEH